MSVTAIVGANWGDEGKGKLTDYLAEHSDLVVRFQGGKNAGHTIINQFGKFALHLLPSGVFYQNIINVLGPGVAVDIEAFLSEREQLIARGIPEPNLKISDRAQIVMPFHILFDKYEEERLKDKQYGSTKSGIAPFYSDKYLKIGIQIADLYNEARLRDMVELQITAKNILLKNLYDKPLLSQNEIVDKLLSLAPLVKPFVCDTLELFSDSLKKGKQILLEGQLGALRDPDHGIYPHSTSSSTLAGFGTVGAGIPPYAITRVIAVSKAYSSCVGAGPFVSEIFGKEAEELRNRGGDAGEYGATTGRPRRMGWFDVVASRYGCKAQGANEVSLSLLDVLGYMDEINVCEQYEIDGERTNAFPVSAQLDRAKPILKKFPGWKSDISGIRKFEDLPKQAQQYVLYIEEKLEVPIKWVSVGPRREAMIHRA